MSFTNQEKEAYVDGVILSKNIIHLPYSIVYRRMKTMIWLVYRCCIDLLWPGPLEKENLEGSKNIIIFSIDVPCRHPQNPITCLLTQSPVVSLTDSNAMNRQEPTVRGVGRNPMFVGSNFLQHIYNNKGQTLSSSGISQSGPLHARECGAYSAENKITNDIISK